MRHKHADLIIAWANGAKIQILNTRTGEWDTLGAHPCWPDICEYRIKPEPKPDLVMRAAGYAYDVLSKVQLTFDGNTGELKDAKVIK